MDKAKFSYVAKGKFFMTILIYPHRLIFSKPLNSAAPFHRLNKGEDGSRTLFPPKINIPHEK